MGRHTDGPPPRGPGHTETNTLMPPEARNPNGPHEGPGTPERSLMIVAANGPHRADDLLDYALSLGMTVIGPLSSEASVRDTLRTRTPDAALIDCTDLAACDAIMQALSSAGVPFMVVHEADAAHRVESCMLVPAHDSVPIQLDDFARDMVVVRLPPNPAKRARLHMLLGALTVEG